MRSGTLRGIQFFGIDVTEARQIGRAKDKLIGVVSHELFLVNDLLDLERLEAGQLTMERRSVSLNEIFSIARDATAPLAEQAGVRLEWSPDDEVIFADPELVARVLINLVGKAVKFTPAGKCVSISATRTPDECQVRVHDEGRGIPPDAIERLLERFMQVARADAVEKGGSGLGLNIARAIVLAHGAACGWSP